MRRSAAVTALVAACAAAVLTVAVAARLRPLIDVDQATARHSAAFAGRHASYVSLARWVSTVLGPTTWAVLGAALTLVLLATRRVRHAGAVLVATVLGATVDSVGKALLSRDRPSSLYPVLGAARVGGHSFPSGHAVAAVVGVGVLLWIGTPALAVRPVAAWSATAIGSVIVLLVGWSRIALAAHWSSDVVAGLLIGVVIVAVAVAACGPVPARRHAQTQPDAQTPRGAASHEERTSMREPLS